MGGCLAHPRRRVEGAGVALIAVAAVTLA